MKVLDFGLQMPTGPRQIEETGFAFIHVIVILYSADIWHEVMLFFTLWLVPQLWNVRISFSKFFFTNYKKKSKIVNFDVFYITRMLILCSILVQRDVSNMSCTKKIQMVKC